MSRTDLVGATRAIDLSLRKTAGATPFNIGVYHRDVGNYLYADLLDRDPVRNHALLLYQARDARFTGIDGQLTHRLERRASVTVFGDYVRADLKHGAGHLPRVPPARLGLRYDWSDAAFSGSAEYVQTFGQDRIAATETGTGGYGMLNASLLWRPAAPSLRGLEFYLRGVNLADRLAYSHTSFVKAQSPLRGRYLTLGVRREF